jgi:hypothetical protein
MLYLVDAPATAPAVAFDSCGASRASGAERYVAALKAELGITEDQAEAWAGFAECLWANARRMGGPACAPDLPFGRLQDRLAAAAAMKLASEELFKLFAPAQWRSAERLLPLCCLPPAGHA